MITNNICVYDFETGSKNKNKCQPLQLAAVMVDPIKCQIIENSVFAKYIKPLSDEDAIKKGYDPIEDEALKVNKIELKDLENAPELATVWTNFREYISIYRDPKSKNSWGSPIRSGFNNVNFDDVIIDRLCTEYGPWDDKWGNQNLFHPTHRFDMFHDISRWTSHLRINQSNSISMDSVRAWLGIKSNGFAHNAVRDAFDTAHILIKMLKLYKGVSKNVTFENSFASINDEIDNEVKKYV
jgi:DNA polymerase III epsilon subunit-like protein